MNLQEEKVELVEVIKQQKRFAEHVGEGDRTYYLGEKIGEGGFAAVRRGVRGETGEAVAAKIMPAKQAADETHKREIVAMAALKVSAALRDYSSNDIR